MNFQSRKFYWAIAFVICCKLWLIWDLELFAIPFSPHDDMLFLKNALSLYDGEWLGKYDNLTLGKGAFYPFFLVLNYIIGLPLLFSEHLFYLLACVLVVNVLRKHVQNDLLILVLFVFIAFNPILSFPHLRRITREGVSTTLALLSLFFLLKTIVADQKFSRRHQYVTAFFSGLFLSCFWQNREDGIWIFPPLILIGAYGMYKEYCQVKKISFVLILPLFIVLSTLEISILLVSWKNKEEYRIFTTVETKNAEFVSAYGALTRVDEFERKDFIPVSLKTRELLYEKIPAFKELKDAEPVFVAWAVHNEHCTEEDSACKKEVGGGHFIWALRDAVAAKGLYCDGYTAREYYKRLAREINEACDCEKLKCLPERNTMLPPMSEAQKKEVVKKFFYGWNYAIGLNDYSLEEPESIPGDEKSLYLIKEFTRNNIQQREIHEKQYVKDTMPEKKRALLGTIGKVYAWLVPIFFYIALACTLFNFVYGCIKRNLSFCTMLSFSLLLACAGRIGILVLVEVTSFYAVNIAYMSPVYVLIYIFITVALIETGQTILKKQKLQESNPV